MSENRFAHFVLAPPAIWLLLIFAVPLGIIATALLILLFNPWLEIDEGPLERAFLGAAFSCGQWPEA